MVYHIHTLDCLTVFSPKSLPFITETEASAPITRDVYTYI